MSETPETPAAEIAVAEISAETPAAPPTPMPEVEPKVNPLEQVVEIWFADLRRNLAGLGLETEVHNHLYTAKEDLKVRLSGLTA